MVLHTYCENAVKHGFSMIQSGGLLVVRAVQTGDRVCVSVEDNGVGREVAANNKHVPEILRLKPDLIFLDIQLPDKNGLWLAEELYTLSCDTFTPPEIIFTTAYTDSKYLLKAFKLAAIDYLVKPVMLDSLSEAVKRFKERSTSTSGIQSLINIIKSEKILKFRNFSGVILLKPEDIVFVKADGNYAQIALANGDTEEIFERLGEIEKALPQDLFIRTERSLIINRQYIRRINTRKSLIQVSTPDVSHNLEVPEKALRQIKEGF